MAPSPAHSHRAKSNDICISIALLLRVFVRQNRKTGRHCAVLWALKESYLWVAPIFSLPSRTAISVVARFVTISFLVIAVAAFLMRLYVQGMMWSQSS